jgi:hypothetical protein
MLHLVQDFRMFSESQKQVLSGYTDIHSILLIYVNCENGGPHRLK